MSRSLGDPPHSGGSEEVEEAARASHTTASEEDVNEQRKYWTIGASRARGYTREISRRHRASSYIGNNFHFMSFYFHDFVPIIILNYLFSPDAKILFK